MQTKLTLLGKSDATVAIIMDILESCNMFPHIEIVNNLNLPVEHAFINPKFTWSFVNEVPEGVDEVALGATINTTKSKIIDIFTRNYNFVNLIHSTASISSTTNIGRGCVINNNTSISVHTNIGDFFSMNRNASIGHHVTIGDFVTMNPGSAVAGHVNIGNNVQIGMGAMVIDGVSIGNNTIIGAGSVVTKDIPDNVVAYGSPCKVIRENK